MNDALHTVVTVFSVLFILCVCCIDTSKLGSKTNTKWPKK